MTMTFDLACAYVGLGISVIPLIPHSKKPHFNLLRETGYCREVDGEIKAAWEVAQQYIASIDILKRWFHNGAGIALVGGEVSHSLAYLDFDDIDGYRSWALDHKKQVNITAVQRTAHGYHVFIRTPDTKNGNMYYKDKKMGQVKGEGGYVVCPPSWHPDGIQYRWLRKPEDGILSVGSLAELGICRQIGPTNGNGKTYRMPQGRQVEQVKKLLYRLGHWRADDYESWLRVGLSLSSLGQDGLGLWHEWSAKSGKYNPDVLDKKWQTFDPDGDLSFGSLVYWASQDDPGGREQNRWQTL